MRRLTRPLAAAAICLAGLPVYGARAEGSGDDLRACRAKDQITVRKDRWIQIKAPKVSTGEGAQKIVDYTTSPQVRSRVFSTNGTVVFGSSDAGCTWDTILPGGTNQLHVDQAPTMGILTNLAAPMANSVWLASYDDIDGVAHPHVYLAGRLTDDLSKASFTEISNAMPAAGLPVALAGSVTQADLMYVLLAGPGPDPASGDLETPALHLYATHFVDPTLPADPPTGPPPVDGRLLGLTWKEVPLPDGFSALGGFTPAVAGRGLWIWSGDKYAFAPDSVADSVDWTVTPAGGQVTGIDSDLTQTTMITVKTVQGSTGHLLDYDRKAAGDLSLPAVPTLLAHGSMPRAYTMTGAKNTYGFDSVEQRWINITPQGVPAFRKIQMPQGGQSRVIVAQAGDSLYRWDLYAGERFLPPPPFLSGSGDWKDLLPDPGDLTGPLLRPTRKVVTLKPGELKDVPVDFTVPADPIPLNVYFLMDTTGSMDNAVNGLRISVRNIARRLRNTLGRNACFGLGTFKDIDNFGDTNKSYVREVPIGCDDSVVPTIAEKLKSVGVSGGGGTLPEAATVALDQAMTGKGKNPPQPIAPNQQAGFQTGAYKVIVLITDAAFNQGAGYPTKAQAISDLFAKDIKVVGVQEDTQGADLVAARRDLDETAAGTGTLAPEQGVDCDADGTLDLNPGDPLVCYESGSGADIGPSIISLLLSVVDPGTLAVAVRDKHHVVQEPIKGQTSRVVNLKRRNAIGFALPVMCSKAQDGKDLSVGLLASVRAVPKRYGEVVVRCRSIPLPPPKIPKPPPEPPFDPPRPVKPPVAIAIPNPPPAPAQPISNINLNAGFSQQEEQQYQLAAVTQGASDEAQDDEEFEYAMSDHRARDTAAGGAALGGALILSTAAALAHRRRLQRTTRPGYARV